MVTGIIITMYPTGFADASITIILGVPANPLTDITSTTIIIIITRTIIISIIVIMEVTGHHLLTMDITKITHRTKITNRIKITNITKIMSVHIIKTRAQTCAGCTIGFFLDHPVVCVSSF